MYKSMLSLSDQISRDFDNGDNSRDDQIHKCS